MEEVKGKEGKYAELSPAMMFCMIVAGDLNLQSRPVTWGLIRFSMLAIV